MRLFASVLGAFRISRRRAVEVGQPGLAIWADAGEQAAVAVGAKVRDTAHRAEIDSLEVEHTLEAVLADGKVTPSEVSQLKRLCPRLNHVAGDCHDITEIVQL